MTQQTVPIYPDTVTVVSMVLTSGTTIYNGDAINAVWISSNPGVAPNAGMRIGPKGSVKWTADRQPCYAVVDSGVASAVTLTVSDDITDLVNPVDIGVAVATQLLAQGVPSVLLGELLYSGTVPNTGNFELPVDVSRYANLTVTIKCSDSPQNWLAVFTDSVTGQAVASKEYPQGVIDPTGIVFDITVRGDTLDLYWTNPTAGDITLIVYATNRSVDEGLRGTLPYFHNTIPSRAWAAYEEVAFGKIFYCKGGLHTVHMTPNGAAAKGYLKLELITNFGIPDTPTLFDSSKGAAGPGNETEITETVVLPEGKYRFIWQNGPAAQTYQAEISVYQS